MRKSVIKIKAVVSDVVTKHNGIYRPPEDRRRECTLYISAAISERGEWGELEITRNR